jgi:hypothetical protein
MHRNRRYSRVRDDKLCVERILQRIGTSTIRTPLCSQDAIHLHQLLRVLKKCLSGATLERLRRHFPVMETSTLTR